MGLFCWKDKGVLINYSFESRLVHLFTLLKTMILLALAFINLMPFSPGFFRDPRAQTIGKCCCLPS